MLAVRRRTLPGGAIVELDAHGRRGRIAGGEEGHREDEATDQLRPVVGVTTPKSGFRCVVSAPSVDSR